MNKIESFDFNPGRIFANKYEIVDLIGYGWEGEVYKIVERPTGIERAAKFLAKFHDKVSSLQKTNT